MANIHSHNIVHWLATGERGISSDAIVSHLTGVPVGGRSGFGSYPYDPSDFNRCRKLLESCPELRLELHRMAELGPVWAALVERWDKITRLFLAEVAQGTGMAPRTYKVMAELRGISEKAA
ncbi:hypothetical protein PGC08_14230 [Brevibacterium sp. BDJS002]|uniref:hypothetical protein n=1 Tax=Brevibacterium sp. BDJS002 TaxID=3020906 RepID=UPI002307931F|nr:hypothetical protein [Brevibacterium sp. BDJS002]WCE39147.1 hypothetical protein PGC08_14230 [Brevibacterium sp. BDJS002]